MILSIDIETYCDLSLKDCGVYKYAAHPSFKILLFAYAIDDEPVGLLDLENGDKIPKRLKDLIYDKKVTKSAHNAQFERTCLSAYFEQHLPCGMVMHNDKSLNPWAPCRS